ncbi:MAG: hypothetical protein IPM97_01060 [Bdellovibrionaceae bacterium]|nr:hypothetical protein [Pseudobdellovibrionaceae bacterium]
MGRFFSSSFIHIKFRSSAFRKLIAIRFIFVVLTLLFTHISDAALNANPGINYTGRIMSADGVTPVTSASVAFSVAIYDVNRSCLLYTESRSLDLSTTAGTFSFDIGDGAAGSSSFNGNVTDLYDLFNNSKTFTGLTCSAPHTGFTPASASEPRILMVSFDAGDGSGVQNLPALKINPVPSALQAYKVNGYGTGDLLRIDSVVDKTANSNTDLSQTQYDEFWRLVKNPNAAYLSSSTSLAGDVTGAFATNTVVKIQGQSVSATAPTNGQILVFNGTAWTPVTPAASGVASVVANLPLSVSGSATSTISISQAGAAADGYLSSTDWNIFNNKQTSALANGKILVGNASGQAEAVTMSGDATIDTAGALTLATSGVTAGTYSKVGVDAKGRVLSGSNLASSDITAALGFTPVNKAGDVMGGNLSLVSVTSDPAGLLAGDEGKMWYRSDLNTIMYWDGAAAIPLGVAGAGMQSMNGLVATAQSFVVGTAGTNITVSSVGSTHTLDIPTASAANRGALSAADWSLFNNKMGTSLNSAQIWVGNSGNAATAVTMSGDATLDNTGALAIGAGKITAPMLSTGGINAATSGVIIAGPAGNLVNFACSTSGHVLKWSVIGWSCAYPDPSLPTLANGKIWVGNSGNAATEVTMSGDVSIDTAGVSSLSTTGVTAGDLF